LSCNFNHFVNLASTRLRLPEDDADAKKHVRVLKIYKILIYICMCVCVCVCVCVCAFVSLDNKLYTMHGMYIRMIRCGVYQYFTLSVNIGITLA